MRTFTLSRDRAPHPELAWSRSFDDSRTPALIIAVGALAAAALAYVLTHRGLTWAGLLAAAPVAVYWITHQRGNGFLLAVIVLLVVPYWYAHVWLVAPTVATLGWAAGVARTRVRAVDILFLLLVIVMAVSWFVHPSSGVSTKLFAQGMLAFAFYPWARLAITEQFLPRLERVMLGALAIASCTVLFEAARGSAFFVSPLFYQWSANITNIFRAGGVFGGSPAAATVLAIILLASAGFHLRRPRVLWAVRLLALGAIVITFDRSGWFGLLAGIVLLAVLLPYRRWGRLAMVALALSIPIYAVTSSSTTLARLSTSKLVNSGVVRSATVSVRGTLLSQSSPLVADTPGHLLFGRGFDAVDPQAHAAAQLGQSQLDAGIATRPILLDLGGPNNNYLEVLLNEGLVGLILMLAWLGGSIVLGVRTCLALPRESEHRRRVAGLTAAVLVYTVAAIGHDMTSNYVLLGSAALISGVLVSVCTLAARSAPAAAEPDGT